MNYKVLYRKYRPDNFDNLVGQEYVKTILKNSIINDKISHAYIFAGPRGTGKTSTAKIFAKAINCLDNKNGEACGKCVNCENFNTNSDIIEIDAASNNGVDQIREITNNIKLAPTMSKYKVYIIDEVHMLSQSAFNALLLTLEEPPQHVIFILATTNIESVPITVLSRCQRFDFKKIDTNEIINRLSYVSKQEKIKINDDALTEIAYIADGGMRDALSVLDQLSKDGKSITLEDVISKVGSVSFKSIERIFGLIEQNSAGEIINQINDFRNAGLDYKLIVKKLIDIAVKKARDIVITGKIERLNYKDYKDIVIELTDALNIINVNVDAYSMIELILLEHIVVTLEPNKDDKQKPKIIQTKPEITNSNIDKVIDIRIHNCFVNATKNDKITAIEEWKKYLKEIDNKKIKSVIMDTEPVLASNEIYVIMAPDHVVDEFNEKNDDISFYFNKTYKKKIKIVAINKDKWKVVSEKFVSDKKLGIVYQYETEPKIEKINELERIATDLFDSDKIEMQ